MTVIQALASKAAAFQSREVTKQGSPWWNSIGWAPLQIDL